MARTRRSRRWISGFGVAVVIGGLLVAPAGRAMATPAVPQPATTDPTGVALQKARTTGKSVVVNADTTETSSVTANPDGTLTSTQSLVPRRRQVDGTWEDLDATLQHNGDGTISPAATLGDLQLSPGGTGPLATVSSANTSLSFTAPMTLPAPTLSGATATYASVLPGVDLEVTADDYGGFTPVFVIKDATAAANPMVTSLTFTTQSSGLTISADANGNLRADNRVGQAIYTAPSPMGWDSTTTTDDIAEAVTMSAAQAANAAHGLALTSTAAGAGEAADQVPLSVAVGANKITLTPPSSLLAGPNTVYPVYLDPSWTLASWGASKTGYASVPEALSDSNKWNNSGDPDPDTLQVGNADGWISRAMINFPINVTTLKGATISTATLEMTDTYAYSCTATVTDLYAPTTLLTASNATWDYWSDVSDGSVISDPSFAHGYTGCAAAGVSFSIGSAISADISADRTSQTFELRSPSESNSKDYKEFSAKSATLSVTYNHPPATPTSLATSPTVNCAAAKTAATTVGDGPVSLYAKVSDPDGQNLGVTFTLATVATMTTPSIKVVASDPDTLIAASGTTTALAVPRATLDGVAGTNIAEFQWTVQTTDGFANSATSTICYFNFDPTLPGAPSITPPAGDLQIGADATFTISPQTPTPGSTTVTPTGYLYQLNGGASNTVPATSGSATIAITPNAFTNILTVTSTSAGGNIGDTARYIFNAKRPSPAADGDFTGDGVPDLVAAGGPDTGLPAGLWLGAGVGVGSGSPDRVNIAGRNIGVNGNGIFSDDGGSADFDGADVITGHFTDTNLQDVLVYYPAGQQHPGDAEIINGSGDGTPLQPDAGDSLFVNTSPFEADGTTATLPLQLANAGDVSGYNTGYADLIGIAGDGAGNYYLALYPNGGGVASYGEVDPFPGVNPPSDGTDWSGWTIATAQTSTGAVDMFLWDKSKGQLWLWTDLHEDLNTGSLLTDATYQLSSDWNTNQQLTLSAADLNGDGVSDLRTVGASGTVTAYQTSLTGDTGTVTAQSPQTLMTSSHAWGMDDDITGDVTTVHDGMGTLDLTGSAAGVTWNTGDLYSPDVQLDGMAGMLTTTGPAVATNADFTVSAWVKPTAAGGTVISQDSTNNSEFKIWAEPSDKSWRFAMSRTDTTAPVWDTAAAPAGSLQLGVWTLITATYRQTGGAMTLYLNGGLVGRATHTTTYNNTSAPLRIGAQKTSTNPIIYGSYFTGQIAQVQTWNIVANGNVAIFGILPSNQLTYSEIDSNTGDHIKDLTSTTTFPWQPVAMTVLNADTLLITDTNGHLYRVDITATDTTLDFNPPTDIATGWTHRLLAADGVGDLYGIAGTDNTLRSYTVTNPKPASSTDFTNNTVIGTGFTLEDLTATGPGWILGNTTDGALRNYHILGAGNWPNATLDPDGWGFENLISPGDGLYYGRLTAGSLWRYKDANPYDLNGSDVEYFTSDPVDHTGWNQTLLAAQPNTVG